MRLPLLARAHRRCGTRVREAPPTPSPLQLPLGGQPSRGGGAPGGGRQGGNLSLPAAAAIAAYTVLMVGSVGSRLPRNRSQNAPAATSQVKPKGVAIHWASGRWQAGGVWKERFRNEA